ncbi:hypothetical protein [Spirulina subsalsa]|uniref:hypothetical protein n=1 Tax=Spirulina subsalsa TaxID=54311 RepID=UPI0002D9E362|nr:hypothetical protein [Spirulina subsalsa]
MLIRDLTQQVLKTGYLTLETEAKLRTLIQMTQYDLEDLRAFTRLQCAVMDGWVIQQSRCIRES